MSALLPQPTDSKGASSFVAPYVGVLVLVEHVLPSLVVWTASRPSVVAVRPTTLLGTPELTSFTKRSSLSATHVPPASLLVSSRLTLPTVSS